MPEPTFQTAESRYPEVPGAPAAERVLHAHWFERDAWGNPVTDHTGAGVKKLHVIGNRVPDKMAPKSAPPARAHFDVNRWLAACPFCPAEQYASYTDRRFFCTVCENKAVGGRWVPLEWPDDPAAVEAVMLARPAENRYQLPGETVAELRDENVAQGFPPDAATAKLSEAEAAAARARWREKHLANLADSLPAWPGDTPPPAGYDVAQWLERHPDHPSAAKLRQALKTAAR